MRELSGLGEEDDKSVGLDTGGGGAPPRPGGGGRGGGGGGGLG